MQEKPILFSDAMVRALLNGRKTQTRRIVKGAWHEEGGYLQSEPEGEDGEWWFSCAKVPASFVTNCPYGGAKDLLWVKETFCIPVVVSGKPKVIAYAATESQPPRMKWKPSIFMPRALSRITLKLTGVRVERVQDISARDCIAEGIPFKEHACGCEFCSTHSELCPATQSSLVMAYAELWDSIQLKSSKPKGAFAWSANPWVWVLSFSVKVSNPSPALPSPQPPCQPQSAPA